MKQLTDKHGRSIRKLRLSLTDKCNLRCHYCMPVDAKFMREEKYLSAMDYVDIVSELCELGLEELRITGGEPLMRKSFSEITERLAELPLKKIGLTTNAVSLDRHLAELKKHNVVHLNISLDSLCPETFQKITYGNQLSKVLANIEKAQMLGFKIKINTVVMRGVNDHEIDDFVEYSHRDGLEVRFLELMRVGYAREKQIEQFISAREIADRLNAKYKMTPVARDLDSTSINFTLDNGAQIGFIASESQAFCGQCSRWRLSADGILRACLFKDDGIALKGKSSAERNLAYYSLLDMKPILRPLEVTHQMNAIGG